MSKAPSILKISFDLGLRIAANVPTSGIPDEVQRYYLSNPHLIPGALFRGFVLPEQEVAVVPRFKTADTNLFEFWIPRAERFAKNHFGLRVNLREMFQIPEELPWKSAIPVFDPGSLSNRDGYKLLEKLRLNPWEEVDVMEYSGSRTSKELTLHLIQTSTRPDEDTMEISPNRLVETGRNWLDLRGYQIAFGLYYTAPADYLDSETLTWFPKNRLSNRKVAHGDQNLGNQQVRFACGDADYESTYGGTRLAISCPLKT